MMRDFWISSSPFNSGLCDVLELFRPASQHRVPGTSHNDRANIIRLMWSTT